MTFNNIPSHPLCNKRKRNTIDLTSSVFYSLSPTCFNSSIINQIRIFHFFDLKHASRAESRKRARDETREMREVRIDEESEKGRKGLG